MRAYPIAAAGAVLALVLPLTSFAQAGMPPSAAPSTYYVLPGQTLSFAGYHFAPGEMVSVMGPSGVIATVTASQSGSFLGQAPYVVPFAYEHSTQTFYV